MSDPKDPPSPRQKVVNPDGTPERTYWRYWTENIQNIGTTANDLVVAGGLLKGATVSSGGTIEAADIAGYSLLGNPISAVGQPQVVSLDVTLGFVNAGSIGIATQAAQTVLGAETTGQPKALALGGNLFISSGVLSDGGSGGGGSSSSNDLGFYAAAMARNRIIDLERKVDDAMTLAFLGYARRPYT